MTRISFVNEKFIPHEKAFVHIEDRGFQFAGVVYEVVLFYDLCRKNQKNCFRLLFTK